MNFEFATATRILFGPGKLREAAPAAASLGKRPFLAVDFPERAELLVETLKTSGLTPLVYPLSGEPTIDSVLDAVRAAREGGSDLVIGMGGGSVLDTAKAVAALLTNPGDLLDYLEVVGPGRAIERPSASYIAIPTTAGTGSEVTRNAVIAVPEQRVKVSLRSPHLLPRLAIVDPELTLSLPPALTASTGMDALTQCIEPYVCSDPSPITDALCLEGIRRAGRSLVRAYQVGSDRAAREDMALVSLFGGLALANARLGAVHGLAGPIGGMFPAPHGAVCARLLPEVVEENIRAMQAYGVEAGLRRYQGVAVIVLSKSFDLLSLVNWLHALLENLKIPPLSSYGVRESDIPSLVDQAQKASSMKGNPIPLTDADLSEILRRAL